MGEKAIFSSVCVSGKMPPLLKTCIQSLWQAAWYFDCSVRSGGVEGEGALPRGRVPVSLNHRNDIGQSTLSLRSCVKETPRGMGRWTKCMHPESSKSGFAEAVVQALKGGWGGCKCELVCAEGFEVRGPAYSPALSKKMVDERGPAGKRVSSVGGLKGTAVGWWYIDFELTFGRSCGHEVEERGTPCLRQVTLTKRMGNRHRRTMRPRHGVELACC
jgi:hypothetical protein